MNPHDLAATTEWVRRWTDLAGVLERVECDRRPPLSDVLQSFNGAFRSAMELHPPEPFSGLVEQQAIFKRAVRPAHNKPRR